MVDLSELCGDDAQHELAEDFSVYVNFIPLEKLTFLSVENPLMYLTSYLAQNN